MSSDSTRLSAEAADVSATLPPLLAEAERAAANIWGMHGRRSSGMGETFWQYRHAFPGDSYGAIDWRRSGRSDDLFVRETEWETAQCVYLWPDAASSMQFRSSDAPVTKAHRAAVMALATALLLERGDEHFALMLTAEARKQRGRSGIERIALQLTLEGDENPPETGTPPEVAFSTGARVLFLSDFFGDLDRLGEAVAAASHRRVRGMMLQIVDPVEEAFPYRGRVLFESVGGGIRYDLDRAESVRDAYVKRLEERRDALRHIARRAGWSFAIHRTDAPVTPALMAVYRTLEAKRVSG